MIVPLLIALGVSSNSASEKPYPIPANQLQAIARMARSGRYTAAFLTLMQEQMRLGYMLDDKRVPRLSDVLAAERVLAKTRCVGRVARWNRKYAFTGRRSPIRLDTSTIEFLFATPHSHYQPGRDIVRPSGLVILDDGFFDVARGTYAIRTHKVTFSYCGPNHPDAPEGPSSRPRAPSIDRPDLSPLAARARRP